MLKRLWQQYLAWKNRPPTPAETLEARQSLIIVQDYINKSHAIYKDKDPNLYIVLDKLGDAAYHLRAARRLDPAVTLLDEKSGFTMTTDYLVGEILYWEAYAHYAIYRDDSRLKQIRTKHRRKALRAIERSLEYSPNDVLRLQKLAEMHPSRGAAKRALEKARKIDPGNPETIRMQREMNRLW